MVPAPHDAISILTHHRLALFDAYGVLLGAEGPLPHARELIAWLQSEKRDFFVVTNDSSRTPERISAFYRTLGFAIPPEQILSSGGLLAPFVAARRLVGRTCMVLGPQDAVCVAEQAGLRVLPWESSDVAPEMLVVADESGFPVLKAMDHVLSLLFRRLDVGKPVVLVLPNPDVIYPKKPGEFGFAAGSLALLFEKALENRYGPGAPTFARLGKPSRLLFDRACEIAGTRDAVMFGDQLETDVRGANDAGLSSVLVETGIGRWTPDLPPHLTPTYRLKNLGFPQAPMALPECAVHR